MEHLLRKDVMELDQDTDFYQPPANMVQFTENPVDRWVHQKKQSQLVSPPGEDDYYFSKNQPSYYAQDEAHLFVEKSKQTNNTTNTRAEQEKVTNTIKKEPRKAKREPHNAIERKRRNNINENIKYLGQLLPENMCQGKVSKGTILKGSVLYVKTLKDQLTNYKLRLDYLERQVAALNGNQQLPL